MPNRLNARVSDEGYEALRRASAEPPCSKSQEAGFSDRIAASHALINVNSVAHR